MESSTCCRCGILVGVNRDMFEVIAWEIKS
jgi:hypothetical protein